jgi:hypothetical protein
MPSTACFGDPNSLGLLFNGMELKPQITWKAGMENFAEIVRSKQSLVLQYCSKMEIGLKSNGRVFIERKFDSQNRKCGNCITHP